MNLKGLLPPDVEYIQKFFADIVETHRLDVAETFLVRHSIMRIMCNEFRIEGAKLPGDWRDPTPREFEVTHIVDWLVADLNAAALWLANVDEQGRPRKLLKCSTIADLMREADKAMDRRNGGRATKKLGPDDEETVADLGGGYTLVRLLTPEALDLESDRMHHCIGDGAYDGKLKAGWGRFLSVRDRKNRPVATIELRREGNAQWSLRQFQGKNNGPVPTEVSLLVRSYAEAMNWGDRYFWWPVAETPDGTEYHLESIPEGATLTRLDASDDTVIALGEFSLPANLTVFGDVFLSPKIGLPENLTICGVLSVSHREKGVPPVVLPESLHVDGEIRLWNRGDVAEPIPTHLYPIIKVALPKLTGHTFGGLPVRINDDPAPRM